MSWHRALLALLLTVAIGTPLFFAASDSRAGNDEVRLVVLVASGWNSTGAGEQTDWIYVSKAIRDAAGSDTDVVVQPFSYLSGGAAYNACDTNQSIVTSAGLMAAQTDRLMSLYPNARLMVVGHSLGGVVASYWLGSLVPGLAPGAGNNDRLRDATVVTLDSPVKGLGEWSDADQRIGHYGSDIVKSIFCNSKIPPELDSTNGSAVLTGMSAAASNPRYHTGASKDDRLIWSSTAVASKADSTTFSSGMGPGSVACEALEALAVIAPGYASQVLPAYVAAMAKCWLASHGAVLQDPAATVWVAGIAKGLLSKDVVKKPQPGASTIPVPSPDFGDTQPPSSGQLKPTVPPAATTAPPGVSVVPPKPTTRPVVTTVSPKPTTPPVATTAPPKPTTPPAATTVPPQPVSVSIWTDRTDYAIGDPATVCYSVSRAGRVRITDSGAGRSATVILDGIDDGKGDCLPGTIDGPPGTETMLIQFFDGSGVELARDSWEFRVGGPPQASCHIDAPMSASATVGAFTSCIASGVLVIGQQYIIQIDAEAMWWFDGTQGIGSLLRAQNGTVAAPHANGAVVTVLHEFCPPTELC